MNRYTPAALVALALIATPAVADATPNPTVDEWHTWTVTEVFTDTPRNAGDVAWPQTYLGAGQVTPSCGWVQQDRYKGKRSVIDAILADGILTYGEDFGVVKEWRYVYAGPCTTPTPTPTPTVTPPPEPTPTATPEPTPTPTATPEPTPEPTVTPTPTPEPTPEPTTTPKPLPTTTPEPRPTATPTAGIGTPQYTEAPTASVERLAETGSELVLWPITISALAAIGGGFWMRSRRKA